jgi:3-keto-disaccharide hydrolase
MRTLCVITLSLLAGVSPGIQARQAGASGWVTLLDGTTLNGWNTTGNANWKVVDGAVEASTGNGMLVTPASYANFELSVEFWVDAPANSGVFIRCSDPATINQNNAYEVNIYDTRPDQTYATGAIVEVSPPAMPMKAAGKWNTFEIRAEGNHLTVSMNGTKTVDVRNDKYSRGPIGLQYGAGVVKFRSVKIRTL